MMYPIKPYVNEVNIFEENITTTVLKLNYNCWSCNGSNIDAAKTTNRLNQEYYEAKKEKFSLMGVNQTRCVFIFSFPQTILFLVVKCQNEANLQCFALIRRITTK